MTALSLGCDDSGGGAATGGGTGTGGGTSTGTGGGTSTGEGIALTPDATGWVDKGMNMAGVQGAWYAYGDGQDGTGAPMGTCQKAGHTAPGECSVITTPAPGMFANTGGKMCTSGEVAKVLKNSAGADDYSNMWGAGIGLDLNSSGGAMSVKAEFDASAYKGISFHIDTPPLAGLRVEFPSLETEAGTAGGDYWGADPTYKNSPVVMGTNTFTWDKVTGPGPAATAHKFSPAHILSIQFHVPTTLASKAIYSFCISDLKLIK